MVTFRQHQSSAGRANAGIPKSPEHRAKLALALKIARAAKAAKAAKATPPPNT